MHGKIEFAVKLIYDVQFFFPLEIKFAVKLVYDVQIASFENRVCDQTSVERVNCILRKSSLRSNLYRRCILCPLEIEFTVKIL